MNRLAKELYRVAVMLGENEFTDAGSNEVVKVDDEKLLRKYFQLMMLIKNAANVYGKFGDMVKRFCDFVIDSDSFALLMQGRPYKNVENTLWRVHSRIKFIKINKKRILATVDELYNEHQWSNEKFVDWVVNLGEDTVQPTLNSIQEIVKNIVEAVDYDGEWSWNSRENKTLERIMDDLKVSANNVFEVCKRVKDDATELGYM